MFFASFLVDFFFAPNGCEKFSAKDSKILSIHADFITTYYFEFCGFRIIKGIMSFLNFITISQNLSNDYRISFTVFHRPIFPPAWLFV